MPSGPARLDCPLNQLHPLRLSVRSHLPAPRVQLGQQRRARLPDLQDQRCSRLFWFRFHRTPQRPIRVSIPRSNY